MTVVKSESSSDFISDAEGAAWGGGGQNEDL